MINIVMKGAGVDGRDRVVPVSDECFIAAILLVVDPAMKSAILNKALQLSNDERHPGVVVSSIIQPPGGSPN